MWDDGSVTAGGKSELELSGLPQGAVRRYRRFLCLACIFDIYTGQLGLGPRTAYTQVKGHIPSPLELTAPDASRPYFDSGEKNPRCPYCNSAKRWHAPLETYRIEGGKATDAARRRLVKSLPKSGDPFLFLEEKTTRRAVFFEWLDAMGRRFDFDNSDWLLEAAGGYLERKDPRTNWAEIFDGVRVVRPSSRLQSGWDRDRERLFLAPDLYYEVLLVQYLVSRSHRAGGRTFLGRLTLPELLRRLRYAGYLDPTPSGEEEQFDLLERLIDRLSGGDEAIKLHYVVDRRKFLEQLRTVYAHYAN